MESGFLAECRGCVRDVFMRSRSCGAGRRAMSSTALVPGMVETLRTAAGHVTFLFVGLDFAAQAIHDLDQGRRNIWRRARPASESLLLFERKLEMYV